MKQMKTICALFILILLSVSMTMASDNDTSAPDLSSSLSPGPVETPTPQALRAGATDPILGERIDGPANVRDGINGKLLFTLYDQTLVTCSALENGWYHLGIIMDINTTNLGTFKVTTGQKIMVDGKEVGEIKSDMTVYTEMINKQGRAKLTGYTHKNNIRPESITENVLSSYIQAMDNSRTLVQLQPFIDEFALERNDQFEGFTVYYNYENWLDDPSPMWRIGLVFQQNKLVAVLHARPLSIPGTTNYKLEKAFDCQVYDDIKHWDVIFTTFNRFVQSVD